MSVPVLVRVAVSGVAGDNFDPVESEIGSGTIVTVAAPQTEPGPAPELRG